MRVVFKRAYKRLYDLHVLGEDATMSGLNRLEVLVGDGVAWIVTRATDCSHVRLLQRS